jgi:hypothetical protein
MAKIWFVREANDPTTGTPAYDISLEQCIDQLGLTKNDWLQGLDQKTHLHARRIVAGPEYRHVVCEIDEQEASEEVWRAGFYLLEIGPRQVAERLGPPKAG